ncbi:MAG: phosphatidylserine decarboxylase family protein [Acidobacteriota bacterium]
MRIAPESRPFLAAILVLIFPAWWLGGVGAAGLLAAAFLFVLFFFRDPARQAPTGAGLVLSPADGRVVDLELVEDALFPDGRARRISIFLSLFNVHVNRSPVNGTVRTVRYSPGRFRAAFRDKASEENERNRLEIESDHGPMAVTQIAGALARRIVCDVSPGDRIAAGARFGMIRFGSRVEILLPEAARSAVRVGQKVRSASTILARFTPGPVPDRQTGGSGILRAGDG